MRLSQFEPGDKVFLTADHRFASLTDLEDKLTVVRVEQHPAEDPIHEAVLCRGRFADFWLDPTEIDHAN